jgi:hypothetical protein
MTESDTFKIPTAEEAAALPAGTWVADAEGTFWCLVDTHLGGPQRMAMDKGGRSFIALEGLSYPLDEAEINGECRHSRGANEMGHCLRCGQVTGELRPVTFDAETRQLMHEVALHNARYEESLNHEKGGQS